jgi:hypothetical protein
MLANTLMTVLLVGMNQKLPRSLSYDPHVRMIGFEEKYIWQLPNEFV